MGQENNKVISRNVVHRGIVIGICLAIIIPFLVMAFYSRPCVDDYNYSSYVHNVMENQNWNIFTLIKAAIDVDKQFYNSWQGLYTSAFLLALQPGIFGEKVYCIGAVVLVLFILVTLQYFCKTICKLTEADISSWMFAFVGLSIILVSMPEITEGLYWFNGAWNYIPFFFLVLVNVASLLRFVFIDSRKNVVHLIFSVFLSFVISGGNHVTAFLNILILLVMMFFLIRKKWPVIISLVSAVVGFYIMYKAPGTAIRQSAFVQPSAKDTIVASIQELRNISGSYINIVWVATMIMAVGIGVRIGKNKKVPTALNPLILFILSIIIECGVLCVPYKAMGNFGAGRVYNIIWLTYMLMSFINVSYLTMWLKDKGIGLYGMKEENLVLCIAILMLFLMIIPYSNYSMVKRELRDGTAKLYADTCDERYEQMHNAKPGDVCYTKALPLSEALYFDDVSWDNEAYQNVGWREYYGASMVLVE